ncbi:MAG: hypothetical protein KTR29_06160 [Rhodothermaceae bacterium]|nr:hypothetical protein [Rhodothermaceae bacterium]
MNVYLPEICDQASVFAVLGQVFDEDGECYSDHYLFDAQAVTVVDPFCLVLLNNLFAWLHVRGHTLQVEVPQQEFDSTRSLVQYIHPEGVYPFNDAMNVHDARIPLAHIPIERSPSWVLTTFYRWLAEVLGVSTLSLFTPMQFMRLLFQYAKHNGQSKGIFLHASLDKESHQLHILLAHYGEGIPDLTRNAWSSISNPAVEIAKATEHNTFHDALQAREGSSLLFLVDDVIIENGGSVSIHSGFGHMEAARNELGITQKLALSNAYVPGALFDISFRMEATGLMSRINEPVDEVFSA